MIAHAPDFPEWAGRSVAEIAAQRGADPGETALDLLIQAKGRVSVVHFSMEEEGLKKTYDWIKQQYLDRKAGKRAVS